MKRLIVVIFAVMGVFASPDEYIRNQVKTYVDQYGIAGVAVALYYDGKEHYYNFGYAHPRRGEPITQDTIFELGSSSKTFTATILAQEVVEGRMGLDDPIVKYLPYLENHPCPLGQVTLKQLATHSSSLPRMPRVPKRLVTKRRMLNSLRSWRPAEPPGTHFNYSNLGFNLLGYVLENETRTPFGKLVRERITEPLGMDSTFLHPAAQLPSTYAQGFNKKGRPAPALRTRNVGAAGGLRSTSRDMLRFIMANLGVTGPKELRDSMRFAHEGFFRANGHMVQGLAWQRIHRDGNLILDKNGGVGGFSTWIGFAPDSKIGLVLLSNQRCNKLVPLGRRLLAELIKMSTGN